MGPGGSFGLRSLPARRCTHRHQPGQHTPPHPNKCIVRAAAPWCIIAAMTHLQPVEHLLTEMSRSEKAQVLQWVVADLGDAFPGVASEPGVSGGEPCIVRTRIPVWLLVRARQLGASEADLLRSYPSLRAEDLSNAWAYFRSHREEVERQIEENEPA